MRATIYTAIMPHSGDLYAADYDSHSNLDEKLSFANLAFFALRLLFFAGAQLEKMASN